MEDIEILAFRALNALPDPFRAEAQKIGLNVTDWPAPDMLADLGLDDPLSLTGLYDGTPLPYKSSLDQMQAPDVIWLFRQPILREWRDRGDVALDWIRL